MYVWPGPGGGDSLTPWIRHWQFWMCIKLPSWTLEGNQEWSDHFFCSWVKTWSKSHLTEYAFLIRGRRFTRTWCRPRRLMRRSTWCRSVLPRCHVDVRRHRINRKSFSFWRGCVVLSFISISVLRWQHHEAGCRNRL